MKKYFCLVLLAGLAGCGNYFSAKVPYRIPDAPDALAARQAAGGLYLVVKAGPQSEGSVLGGLANLLPHASVPEPRPELLAKLAAGALSGPASGVCAWRVDKGGDKPDMFLPEIRPSGLLVISAGRPEVGRKNEERTSVYYDRNKRKQTVKSKVWAYSASLGAEVRLLSVPGMAVLDSWRDTFTYAEDRADKAKDEEDWYADNEEKIYASLASRLQARYLGRQVIRLRPVFKKAKDKESEEAAKLAGRENWAGAEDIWKKRAAAGGWRDLFDLGVSAELKKDYKNAAAYYKQAETAAGGDKDSGQVRWGEIYRDLDLAAAAAPAAACDGAWFGVRTAVLPVTDETTSIDGPAMVRQLLYERLREGGYNLLTLEETDEILRRHGFSDGGQLAAAKPGEIAKWLGAGRLVYGHLTDYGEVMAGVYSRRMVKGSILVRQAGKEDLVFKENVVKVTTPKSFLKGMFTQLATGLAERIQNKPLAYEAGLFAVDVTENLPAALKDAHR